MSTSAFDSKANCQQHGFVSASAFDSMDNCHQAGPDALADPSADLLPCVPFDSMVNCQRIGTINVFAFHRMAICQWFRSVNASTFDSMDNCHQAGRRRHGGKHEEEEEQR